MARINTAPATQHTHEGAVAKYINPDLQLRRSVMACMLWEDTFYEGGEEIAARITTLVQQVKPEDVSQIAIEAREKMKLRHVPLLIVKAMASLPTHKHLVAYTLDRVILRADEITEFLAIYWKDGKKPLSAQIKKGLARAFTKFNAYQLAKYNRPDKIKLKDVLFLVHAKPKDDEQAAVWKSLINGTLASPDTWEVNLSAGKDKKEVWERLLNEKKLGGLALLRNLRNMMSASVDIGLITDAINNMKTERILPFRFISAAKYAPSLEREIEYAMLKCLEGKERLRGVTTLVIDGSGSMNSPLSRKSEMTRFEAAAALAILLREVCDVCDIIVFSYDPVLIPARNGFALRDKLFEKAAFGGTYTDRALKLAAKNKYDRLILITDEQSHTGIDGLLIENSLGYCINVGAYRNGIAYGEWIHIDGWSESILDYIYMSEYGYNHDVR